MAKLVVMGASAGGIEALASICQDLAADFPIPVVLVMHVGPQGNELLEVLARVCSLRVRYARDGQIATPGIWIAAPAFNLTVVNASGGVQFRLSQAGHPHLNQPSINPLFESAARELKEQVIGVLLSGYLDDGVEGLYQIKEAGGKVVIQDPVDAIVRDMPEAVLQRMTVDAILSASAIGPALTAMTTTISRVSSDSI
jgi:two-component system chemotaxis response regulator CheB